MWNFPLFRPEIACKLKMVSSCNYAKQTGSFIVCFFLSNLFANIFFVHVIKVRSKDDT